MIACTGVKGWYSAEALHRAMPDIGEFARLAADRFLEYQKGIQERFNLGLPRQVVEEFVKSVFYASLLPDESRWPSVCLMSYPKGYEPDFHFLFDRPREPSAQEIAKLAYAVAEGCHLCCVSSNGQLMLGGIHVTVLNERRDLGYSSFRVGNPLKLFIRGPGYIEMSAGGLALVYKAGEITEEEPFLHSRVLQTLAAAAERELRGLTRGAVESLEDIFNDLAKAIVRLGHGGLILVAQEVTRPLFSSFRQIDCLLLQRLLVGYWDSVADLHADARGPGRLLARKEDKTARSHSLVVASATAQLEKCVGTIAHLAGMDGAIVMDASGKVVAFNAIIAKLVDSLIASRFVDGNGRSLEYEAVVRNRGSRHHSALAYVMRVPNSFAFVISQDGFISAFHNANDGAIVCEQGMRVLE